MVLATRHGMVLAATGNVRSWAMGYFNEQEAREAAKRWAEQEEATRRQRERAMEQAAEAARERRQRAIAAEVQRQLRKR